jgi:hypothetical protein
MNGLDKALQTVINLGLTTSLQFAPATNLAQAAEATLQPTNPQSEECRFPFNPPEIEQQDVRQIPNDLQISQKLVQALRKEARRDGVEFIEELTENNYGETKALFDVAYRTLQEQAAKAGIQNIPPYPDKIFITNQAGFNASIASEFDGNKGATIVLVTKEFINHPELAMKIGVVQHEYGHAVDKYSQLD